MTSFFGVFFVVWIVETQGTVNLALNKQAFQTDTFDNKDASLAVDGNPSYNYNDGTCTRTVTNDASWEVDLGEVFSVGLVEIYNRIDCCGKDLRDIEVYTGTTREAYTYAGLLPGPAPSKVYFTPLTMSQFRWLKISRKAGSRVPLTLCEVKVFEPVTTTTPTVVTTTPSTGGQNSCNSNLRYTVDSTKQGTSVVIDTLLAMSKIICSVQCRMTAGCQSAIYNHDNSQCHLLQTSDYVANTNYYTVMLTPTA